MLVMGHPQFDIQDDNDDSPLVPHVLEWDDDQTTQWLGQAIDPFVRGLLLRLRGIFHSPKSHIMTSTRLHDLTCYVIHQLLLAPGNANETLSECVRYGIILYMFVIHGTTYYSHHLMLETIVDRLLHHLGEAEAISDSLIVWLTAVGLVGATDTKQYPRFREMAISNAERLQVTGWDEILVHLQLVLWLPREDKLQLFRSHWDAIPDNRSND